MSTSQEVDPKRATMRDVASVAGVPVSAVALTMANKPGVSPARRRAVLRAADEIGYGRSPASQRPLFGLIMEELSPQARSDGYIDALIQGVYMAARLAESQIVLGLYHPGTDPVAELLELAGRPLDGLIVANGGDITLDVIDRLRQADLPMVLVENRVDRPVSTVSCDNVQAGLEATRHLLALGHRRIGLVQGSDRYVSLRDRARGYMIALAEAGVPVVPELVVAQAPHAARKGYEQAHRLLALQDPPTAIYAVSDKSAFGVLAAAADMDLRVGFDLSVVGTDNVEASALSAPGLTTFDTRFRDLGPAVLRDLAALTSNPALVTHTAVQGRLVVRESSVQPAS